MLVYNCRIVENSGTVSQIIIEAADIDELRNIISHKNYTLLSYKKSSGSNGIKLKKDKILLFTQTLQLLLSSNLSLKDSLDISLKTFKDIKLIQFTESILRGLNRGDSLSRILRESRAGFTPLYLGLIQVGETTGTLNIVLDQLHNYLERGKKFNDKLVGALIYPAFILVMTTLFSIVFIIVILPKFNEMFATLGGGLGNILEKRGQVMTLIVIIISLIILLITMTVLYINKLKKNDYHSAVKFEKIYLKIPFIGNIIRDNETFNLIFAMSVLTSSSLSIEKSLEYAKEVVINSYIKMEVEKIIKGISSGEKLSLSFTNSAFPEKIGSFIKVGEKTGDISKIFKNLSEYYLKESDKKVNMLMSIIDPVFTVFLGATLFTLILLFILPVLTKMGDLL